jgi:glyoxylase-like metal-dependent hydrolase (beta-lactamase superfamily II)
MAAAIPFVREMEFSYGDVQQVSPLIRRVVTNNPGPFTFLGTGVYIIGQGDVAIIDPGPDMPDQQEMLKRAIGSDRLTHILLTHGHADHSPAAAPLARATGAKIYANPTPTKHGPAGPKVEADEDDSFRFDVALKDGDVLRGANWTLQALFTPGHTSNHCAFALKEENALFTGDHIMGWSTTVISPPDGNMESYFASLDKVRAGNFGTLWPTHGPPIRDPAPFVDAYKAHRLSREDQILAQIRAGHRTIGAMIPIMYADVDARLHPAAAHSVLAHTIRLVGAGVLKTDGEPTLASEYRLA